MPFILCAGRVEKYVTKLIITPKGTASFVLLFFIKLITSNSTSNSINLVRHYIHESFNLISTVIYVILVVNIRIKYTVTSSVGTYQHSNLVLKETSM